MCEIADWIIMIFLVLAGIIDFRTKQIPMLLLMKLGLCVLLFRMLFVEVSIVSTIGGAAIGVFFFGMGKITREAVGYGDCWLILLLGIYCGGFDVLQIVLFASLGTAVVSVICGIWKGWKRKQEIPFVPFLAAAYMGVMLF